MEKRFDELSAGEAFVAVAFMISILVMNAFCLQWTVEFWSGYFGNPKEIHFMICLLASFFTGGLPIPAWILTCLIM